MDFDQVGAAVHGLLDYIIPIVGAVWPAIAPLIGVLIGAFIAGGQQARAERFQLRQAKLQRLRAAFQPVLLTAWALSDATSPFLTRPPDEEDEARRLMINEAMTGLNQARAQLAMEVEASALNETFQKLSAAYALYGLTLRDTNTGNIPPAGQRLSDKREKVLALVAQLEREMRDTLAKLERGGAETKEPGNQTKPGPSASKPAP